MAVCLLPPMGQAVGVRPPACSAACASALLGGSVGLVSSIPIIPSVSISLHLPLYSLQCNWPDKVDEQLAYALDKEILSSSVAICECCTAVQETSNPGARGICVGMWMCVLQEG